MRATFLIPDHGQLVVNMDLPHRRWYSKSESYRHILFFYSTEDALVKSDERISPAHITPINAATTMTTNEDNNERPPTCCPLSTCCVMSPDSISSGSSSASSLIANYASCIRCKSKSNPNLTILVVFLAVMIDVMLMTVIGENYNILVFNRIIDHYLM